MQAETQAILERALVLSPVETVAYLDSKIYQDLAAQLVQKRQAEIKQSLDRLD